MTQHFNDRLVGVVCLFCCTIFAPSTSEAYRVEGDTRFGIFHLRSKNEVMRRGRHLPQRFPLLLFAGEFDANLSRRRGAL